jgi:hypothetical protein
MADFVPVTAGSGVSIAADDIGGVHYQRVKIGIGADGTAVDAISGESADGDASIPGVIGTMPLHYNGSTYAYQRNAVTVGDGSSSAVSPHAVPFLYNGATFDRQRGNTEGTLLASAARTAETDSAVQTNYNARGVILFLNATVVGTGTVQLHLIGNIGGSFGATISSSVATGTASITLLVYPGVLDADINGDGRSGVVPRSWFARVSKSDGSSWTYSLAYSLIL